MKYDVVLLEKEFTSGLNIHEVISLMNKINCGEVYPVEFESKYHESSAMGFISPKAAEQLDYDYDACGLHDFIALILDDMNNESANNEYSFKGISIYLSR